MFTFVKAFKSHRRIAKAKAATAEMLAEMWQAPPVADAQAMGAIVAYASRVESGKLTESPDDRKAAIQIVTYLKSREVGTYRSWGETFLLMLQSLLPWKSRAAVAEAPLWEEPDCDHGPKLSLAEYGCLLRGIAPLISGSLNGGANRGCYSSCLRKPVLSIEEFDPGCAEEPIDGPGLDYYVNLRISNAVMPKNDLYTMLLRSFIILGVATVVIATIIWQGSQPRDSWLLILIMAGLCTSGLGLSAYVRLRLVFYMSKWSLAAARTCASVIVAMGTLGAVLLGFLSFSATPSGFMTALALGLFIVLLAAALTAEYLVNLAGVKLSAL